jgi:hypothetical protein
VHIQAGTTDSYGIVLPGYAVSSLNCEKSKKLTALEAKSAVQSDFEAHKCNKLDVVEAAAQIVREATQLAVITNI